MHRHAVCFGVDRGVDGVGLIAARRFAAAIVEVILQDDFFFVCGEAFPLAVFRPELLGGRELAKREGGFLLRAEPGAVVKDEAVAIGRKNKRNIEGYGIVQGCCMPSPTLWLLSLASMMAIGMLGL